MSTCSPPRKAYQAAQMLRGIPDIGPSQLGKITLPFRLASRETRRVVFVFRLSECEIADNLFPPQVA
jgi:hypothetical protein